jgi:hypothetical protein
MKTTLAGRLVARLLCLMFLLTLVPGQASAWGREGHRIVARLAARHLTEKTKEIIAAILKADKEDAGNCRQFNQLEDQMACIATWADDVRNSDKYKSTASFHFVNIPIFAPSAARHYDEKYCRNGCTVTAIDANKKVLVTSTDDAARAIAIKFIVHFIGDLHQPLHNANDRDRDFTRKENTTGNHASLPGTGDNDQGGNLKLVVWLGKTETEYGCFNLHSIWDSGIMEKSNPGDGPYTDALNRNLDLPTLKKGSVIDWVNEAFKLALTNVYGALPRPVATDKVCEIRQEKKRECTAYTPTACQSAEVHYRYHLDESYYEKNLPVVEKQLQRGGVRLAKFLNDIFDPAGQMP